MPLADTGIGFSTVVQLLYAYLHQVWPPNDVQEENWYVRSEKSTRKGEKKGMDGDHKHTNEIPST